MFVRRLDELRARPVPGTEGAVNVSPSPDGRWLAFNTLGDELRRVPFAGGAPTTLAGTFRYARAAWGDGVLVVEAFGRERGGLELVPTAGGPARAFTRLAAGEADHAAPVVVPGAGLVVFVVTRGRTGPSELQGELAVAPLDPDAPGPAPHTPLAVRARFPVGVVDGWLVYAGERGLLAARFDARRRAVRGEPVSVLGDPDGAPQWAELSRDGTLLYTLTRAGTTPVLVDSAGSARPLLDAPGAALMNPRLSPDGRRLAIQGATPQGTDALVYDMRTRTLTRLTTSGNALQPTWTPDGRRVVYIAADGGTQAFWWRDAAGAAPAERITAAPGAFAPAVTADGRTLLFQRLIEGRWSLWRLPLDGDRVPRRVSRESFDESLPAPSPDGRWLAYVANPLERPDVFLRPLSGAGAPVQLSQGGGTEPAWSADGRRLFYRAGGAVVAATLTFDPAPAVAERRPLFADAYEGAMPHTNYDAARDGRLVMMAGSTGRGARAVVVLDWGAELRARTAAGR